MKEPVEVVIIELPSDAVRFAEACAGGKDVSLVIEAGLELLCQRLMEVEAAPLARSVLPRNRDH